MERKHTPVYGIKGKLISAVCMLLVAVIMVVSSTYAWFTLSTAPEVTGISTAIGANGALEIRLNGTVDGTKADGTTILNTTFGNLVDLSGAMYGLSGIKLLPSTALIERNAFTSAGYLAFPKYGADGRPQYDAGGKVEGTAITGIYKNNGFYAGDETGVRGVGSASGMSPRQLAYRNANDAVNTAIRDAKNGAYTSLNTYGSDLANIIVKKAMGTDAYEKTEIEQLEAAVADIIDIFEIIEEAYEAQIIAFAASQAANEIGGTAEAGETIYNYVKDNLNDTDDTNTNAFTIDQLFSDSGVTVTIAENQTVTVKLPATAGSHTIGAQIKAGWDALKASKTKATTAQTQLATLKASITGEKTSVTWAELSPALGNIVDANNIVVNGMTADAIKGDTGAFAQAVMNDGGIKVVMNAGSGLYTDIADHCGEYSTDIIIKSITYGGTTLTNTPARMTAKTSQNPTYLVSASADATVAGAPADEATGVLPMTEFYGYVLDLVFRTNAASSNLLLQVEATDRIYGDDNNNEQTMGGGSYMTFKSTSDTFTNAQVKELMKAIRIVFFNPDPTSHAVLGYAKLDVDTAVTNADGVTAKMYMYETVSIVTKSFEYTNGEGEKVTETYKYVAGVADAYYSDAAFANPVTIPEGAQLTLVENNQYTYNDGQSTVTVYKKAGTPEAFYKITDGAIADEASTKLGDNTTDIATATATTSSMEVENKLTGDDAVIVALPQNQEVKVSTLVYLEGDPNKGGVENGDVSATGTASVTGSMNIQFSSSAELTPMEYGDLHTPAETTPNP